MAKEAERLLDGAGWLPEPLRTPEAAVDCASAGETGGEDETLPAFLGGDEESGDEEDIDEPPVLAAGRDGAGCPAHLSTKLIGSDR